MAAFHKYEAGEATSDLRELNRIREEINEITADPPTFDTPRTNEELQEARDLKARLEGC